MKKRRKIPNMQRRRKVQTPVPQENAPEPSGINDTQVAELMAKAEAALASGGNQTRYFVHGPMGLLSQQEPDGTWRTPVQDGLGSIRGVTDDALSILESRSYDPFGDPSGMHGMTQTPFGFTGEMTDPNGLLYLRNRYYSPSLGVFPSPDPVPGSIRDPMSLNRYSYVQNNPVNWVDPSGMVRELPNAWDPCQQISPSCETWLDSAYAALRRGGHWANRAADILQHYRNGQGIWDCVENQPWNIGNVIGFDNPSTGSMAPAWGRIYLNPDYLQTALHCPTGGPTTRPGSYWNAPFCPDFLGYVGVLSQELWHTQQGGVDRYSVWGELEAYNFEIRVRQEINAPTMFIEPGNQQSILSLVLQPHLSGRTS